MAHAMLSKPMATACCPTIATNVDPGIYARLTGTLPTLLHWLFETGPTPQKMLPSDVPLILEREQGAWLRVYECPYGEGGT